MVKPICKDLFILSQKSTPASPADQQVITDLLDTLRAHLDEKFQPKHTKFTGFTAQIIQHEMDHLEGIII